MHGMVQGGILTCNDYAADRCEHLRGGLDYKIYRRDELRRENRAMQQQNFTSFCALVLHQTLLDWEAWKTKIILRFEIAPYESC